jgi:glutamate N-acetyltransferase/amino-acid N-acetyltransferase
MGGYSMSECTYIEGGITVASDFSAAGVCAKIKASRPDMALILSGRDAAVAGTFTTNKIHAAPVKLCRQRLLKKKARAIVINSGNANACTGEQGMVDAEKMAAVTAEALNIGAEEVLVCSTGTIGVPLPMDKVVSGIKSAAGALSDNGGGDAARAIMTTDKVPKEAAVELKVGGRSVHIGGMAKGAGMIEPNMATMLAFVLTDAAVDPDALQDCLSAAVAESFNRISVDGDQSTNDTVLFMANGAAGNESLNGKHPDWKLFCDAVNGLTKKLALKIVEDGEGATKIVTVKVGGAVNAGDARKAARAVADSLLVKTSWYGCDPNWGRVMDAVGYSGAEVKEELVDVFYDDVCAVRSGMAAPGTQLGDLEKVLKKKAFSLSIELNLGEGEDTVYTCDCTEEYVRINSEYMT